VLLFFSDAMRYFANINGNDYAAQRDPDNKTQQWLLDGTPVEAELRRISGELYLLNFNGRVHQLFIKKNTKAYEISVDGTKFQFELEDDKQRLINSLIKDHRQPIPDQKIQAPMPGLIVALCVSEGQKIKKGDTLAIIEAMKMENEIKSSTDGEVKHILVKEKESVDKNAVLLTIEP
jgi:biotin carboxyl carrier protein